jgi:phage shock protein E
MNRLVLIALALALLAGCSEKSAKEDSAASDLTTYGGLSAAMEAKEEFVLYDVRTAEEYEVGHIPGAINIPHDVIGRTIPIEDKDTPIVLYCRSGNRSGTAYRDLKSLGYKNLFDFGGINTWNGSLVSGSSPR